MAVGIPSPTPVDADHRRNGDRDVSDVATAAFLNVSRII
jgi:hypothetical protein